MYHPFEESQYDSCKTSRGRAGAFGLGRVEMQVDGIRVHDTTSFETVRRYDGHLLDEFVYRDGLDALV